MASESSVEVGMQSEIERLYKLATDMARPATTTKAEWIEVHRKLASLVVRSYLAADVVAKEKKRAFEKVLTADA